jgi:hypothetical protein
MYLYIFGALGYFSQYVNIQEIMDRILEIPLERQDKRQRNRIAAMLQVDGFERFVRTIDGKPRKIWGREIGTNPANLSQPDKLVSQNHSQPGSNLPNLPNLNNNNNNLEINSNTAEQKSSELINSALAIKEDRNELDKLMGSAKAVESTGSIADSSSNLPESDRFNELKGLGEAMRGEVTSVSAVILAAGTKVRCERIDKEGVVYSARRKEYNKPNGTTEVVLQYYIELGNEEYRWLDWDLVVVM